MTPSATTALSLHYHVKPGKREAVLVEIKAVLSRCAQEPEFITGIVHETPERPNEFVFYELWKGTRADFDAIQGPKPYRKAYMENVKPLIEKVDVEWNSPILEWGTNLTVSTSPEAGGSEGKCRTLAITTAAEPAPESDSC